MEKQLSDLWKSISLVQNNKDNKAQDDKTAKINIEYITRVKENIKNNQWEKALDYLAHAIEEEPDNIEIHYLFGIVYTKKNNFDKALVHFNEIINAKPQHKTNYNINCILAYIYSKQEDLQTAFEYIEKELKNNPENTKALSIKAFIYYKRKNYEKAKEIYNKLLDIDENNYNISNSLGIIYIESKEDVDKGIKLCEKALKKEPNNPAYLDSVGWGYHKKKDDKKAMEYLKKAFEQMPDNKEIKNHLKTLLDIS